MLCDSGLDKRFWAEAYNTAIYLKKVSPTAALEGKVPEEVWSGERVDLSHLRVFGCRAQVHVDKELRRKLDKKSESYIFVGYDVDSKVYRLVKDDNPRRIVRARNVEFLENEMSVMNVAVQNVCDVSEAAQSVPESILINPSVGMQSNVNADVADVRPHIAQSPEISTDEELSSSVNAGNDVPNSSGDSWSDTSSLSDEQPNELFGNRYPVRDRRPNLDERYVYNFMAVNPSDPSDFKAACSRTDKKLWRRAMEEEIEALESNKTWVLVDRPQNQNIVKSKLIFKLKRGIDGSCCYKVRLVAKGFTQRPGQDYDQTFAPVINLASLRLLFSLAAQFDWEIHHVDITTALLNGELKEVVYMEQPEGFVSRGSEHKVCKLARAIYGLKQAAKCWNDKIHVFLESLFFLITLRIHVCTLSNVMESGL